jgi:hypothetical protein
MDCVFDLTPAMAETSGLHMLAQAAVRRLTTQRGTLIDDLNYGFDVRQFLGSDLSPADVAKIGSQCDSELLKDERIYQSQTTVTLLAGGTLNIVTTFTPSIGPTFQLVALISNISVALLQPTT